MPRRIRRRRKRRDTPLRTLIRSFEIRRDRGRQIGANFAPQLSSASDARYKSGWRDVIATRTAVNNATPGAPSPTAPCTVDPELLVRRRRLVTSLGHDRAVAQAPLCRPHLALSSMLICRHWPLPPSDALGSNKEICRNRVVRCRKVSRKCRGASPVSAPSTVASDGRREGRGPASGQS